MNEDIDLQDPISEVVDDKPIQEEEAPILEAEQSEDPIADGQAPKDAVLFPADGKDQDPDTGAVPKDPALDRMEALERELADLKQSLLRQNEEIARMESECDEFASLYPQTPLSALPDSVWSDVKRGIPIAAAYALAERRKLRDSQLAQASNEANKQRSSGSLHSTQNDYFSVAEVRAMSPAEVRQNYQKIMLSMPKWH